MKIADQFGHRCSRLDFAFLKDRRCFGNDRLINARSEFFSELQLACKKQCLPAGMTVLRVLS